MPRAIRSLILMSLFFVLSACAQPVLVSEAQSRALVVGTIDIDMSRFQGVTGREFKLSPAQVEADVRKALRAVLARPGNANADIKLVLDRVRLVSPGQAFAVGGQSSITGTLSVVGRANNTAIVPPTEVSGISEQVRLGGVIGAVTSPTADKDYQQTLRGFAASVHKQLYGVMPGADGA